MSLKLSTKMERELSQAETQLARLREKHNTERDGMAAAEKFAEGRIVWLQAQVEQAKAFEGAGK